jgi:hypothetical protein
LPSQNVLLEISRCPIAERILGSDHHEHPCRKIVESQGVLKIEDFQVPEPWSGWIETAPLIFLSSNPSISATELYPEGTWTDEMISDFFQNRFANGEKEWIRDGKFSLQKDGSYSSAVRFWASIRKRAEELFLRQVTPGMDYALTEVVHCKSREEIGVKEAMNFCAERYLGRILEETNAPIITVLGGPAKEIIQEIYGLPKSDNPVETITIADYDRHIVYLPHPNAWKKKTFSNVLSHEELGKLRKLLRSLE